MPKADLHVHSKYSNHPSEWFLQRIGASESYTEPEKLYRACKEQGMDYVTITDHNTIDGALTLCEKYPDNTFVSFEATTYFPEDRCKIHCLLYDITKVQFDDLNRLRVNIYELREYVRDHGIAYSIAHALYSINSRLTVEHLEKLIVLFDVFEARNGSRSRINNEPWEHVLKNLTPQHIERFADKHTIEPFSGRSWIKGFTGGSDDHGGLFIGRTYTRCEGKNVNEFIDNVRNTRSVAEGRVSTYQCLAFTIYKIAYDFSRQKSNSLPHSLISQITEHLFYDSKSLKTKFKMEAFKRLKNKDKENNTLHNMYLDLYESIANNNGVSMEVKLDTFYDKLAVISDEFFKNLFDSFARNIGNGDIAGFIRNISSTIPGIFLTIPFLSTLKHFYEGKPLIEELPDKLGISKSRKSKRILWFTDTLGYMNGVSKTLNKIGWLTFIRGQQVRIVSSFPPEEATQEFPPDVINLPYIYEFSLPNYEHYRLRVPSLLRAMKYLYEYEPDEIYVSTPGPVGVLGLLVAKLLNVKAKGVFHTDFTLQAQRIFDDSTVENLIESYMRWFYLLFDDIQVPTEEYINILVTRGYDRSRMSIFRRGIDSLLFSPRPEGREFIKNRYKLMDGFTLMFAGRISEDKNIRFLMAMYHQVAEKYGAVNLIIAGSGPDLPELEQLHDGYDRIIFTGEVDHNELTKLYSGSDLFVFPSTTDTFGMVVLEAQSCGLPAVVSEIGGPREIIDEGRTGLTAPDGEMTIWIEKISHYIDLLKSSPAEYANLRRTCAGRAHSTFDWNVVLTQLTSAPLPFPMEEAIEPEEYADTVSM